MAVLFLSILPVFFLFCGFWLESFLFFIGESSFLLSLVVVLTFLMCFFISNSPRGLILLTCISSLLFFLTDSLLVLFFFFEVSIYPVGIIIFLWGNTIERSDSVFYMMSYSIISSYPLLWGILMQESLPISIAVGWSSLWSLAFMFSFLVNLPLYFFHYWLPIAHVESPSFGSVVLAGLLLNLGGWGLIRVLPTVSIGLPVLLFISFIVLSILLSPLWSSIHSDSKGLVAFSSICHINFMFIPIFLGGYLSVGLGVITFFTHDLIGGLMFWMAGNFYHSSGSRQMLFICSASSLTPSFLIIISIFLLSNFGFPPFITFLHELGFLSIIFLTLSGLWPLLGFYIMLVCYFCLFLLNSILVSMGGSSSNCAQEESLLLVALLFLSNFFLIRSIL